MTLTRNRYVSLRDWIALTVSYHDYQVDSYMSWGLSKRRGRKPRNKSYGPTQNQDGELAELQNCSIRHCDVSHTKQLPCLCSRVKFDVLGCGLKENLDLGDEEGLDKRV